MKKIILLLTAIIFFGSTSIYADTQTLTVTNKATQAGLHIDDGSEFTVYTEEDWAEPLTIFGGSSSLQIGIFKFTTTAAIPAYATITNAYISVYHSTLPPGSLINVAVRVINNPISNAYDITTYSPLSADYVIDNNYFQFSTISENSRILGLSQPGYLDLSADISALVNSAAVEIGSTITVAIIPSRSWNTGFSCGETGSVNATTLTIVWEPRQAGSRYWAESGTGNGTQQSPLNITGLLADLGNRLDGDINYLLPASFSGSCPNVSAISGGTVYVLCDELSTPFVLNDATNHDCSSAIECYIDKSFLKQWPAITSGVAYWYPSGF